MASVRVMVVPRAVPTQSSYFGSSVRVRRASRPPVRSDSNSPCQAYRMQQPCSDGSVVPAATAAAAAAAAGAAAETAAVAQRTGAGSAASSCGQSLQSVQAFHQSGELALHCSVLIGGSAYRITGFLGKGNFGKVWAAAPCQGYGKVAVKEVCGCSTFAMKNVELEVALLRELGDGGNTVPSLMGSQLDVSGNFWRIRMAMDRIPGDVLQRAIIGQRAALPNGVELGPCLVQACVFLRTLLQQMLPAMERVSALVFHRDLHAQNIVLDATEFGRPRFVMIDFGLAVHAEAWRRGGWRKRGVAGDSRYWPVSQWAMFEHDEHWLSNDEDLRHEYEEHLDLHSLGLTSMQVLAELTSVCPVAEASAASQQSLSVEASERHAGNVAPPLTLAIALQSFQEAWTSYWQFVGHCSDKMIRAYQTDGHAEAVKDAFAAACVHDTVSQHLHKLWGTLQGLNNACSATWMEALGPSSEEQAVLNTLLGMVGGKLSCHGGGPKAWVELQNVLLHSTASPRQDKHRPQATASSRACSLDCRGCRSFTSSPPSRSFMATAVGVAVSHRAALASHTSSSASPSPPRAAPRSAAGATASITATAVMMAASPASGTGSHSSPPQNPRRSVVVTAATPLNSELQSTPPSATSATHAASAAAATAAAAAAAATAAPAAAMGAAA